MSGASLINKGYNDLLTAQWQNQFYTLNFTLINKGIFSTSLYVCSAKLMPKFPKTKRLFPLPLQRDEYWFLYKVIFIYILIYIINNLIITHF